ncbi:Gfo/Idh/MocA family protein [Cohnella sp. GCM10027633]|uniref:Gfo/Idh/MocA family protein n=1 Tax=unclassified Cohnella TaxID=2636738 RepID=UPI00363781C0
MRKKYALIGTGHRGYTMFAKPLHEKFSDVAEFVGVCDPNRVRAEYVSEKCGGVPVYDDFDDMLARSGADTVIVTTIDSTHHEYIIRSLRAGCDVISEKPMTTDDEKCRAILAAEQETGRKVTVTFNVRFIPYVRRVKELIVSGAIGDILSVNLEYTLDTDHGADYFRRWHRHMEYGGGLLVHKSTHHFDMINWWVDDVPDEVFAFGSTKFYGPTRQERGERCSTCAYTATCEFYKDISKDEDLRGLYVNAEHVDGYYRDQCVFGDNITTYDTMSVLLKYAKGAQLTYSLDAHAPYEGWKVAINGVNGRIEAEDYEDPLAPGSGKQIRVYDRQGEVTVHHVPQVQGVHGGGDERLLRMLFRGDVADPLRQQAGSWDGAQSILIGISANRSIASKQFISVQQLLTEA